MASKLKTDILETGSGSGTIALNNQLSGMTSASVPSGSVLQVVSATMKDTAVITSSSTNTFVALGIEAVITPISTSSKILIEVSVMSAHTLGTLHFRLARGGDETICIGDAGLSNQIRSTTSTRNSATPYAHNMVVVPITFLDSPVTTSATTYSVKGTIGLSYNGIMYINRPTNGSNADYDPRGTSTITLTEING